MGVCCSVIESTRNIDIESELDKIIIISHSYMKNKITENQIEPIFSRLLYNQLIEEKSDIIKSRHFFKWISMSIDNKQITFSIDINDIINSIKKRKDEENNNNITDKGNEDNNKISLKNLGFSFVENGLRNYYIKNKITFENRILKSPPGVFRWISWEILSNLPESKDIQYYEKLISIKISNRKNNEINLEIKDTIDEKCIISNKIKPSLFRLLKSLIIIDDEIIFFKGISYIIAYLLIITDIDEFNIFYFIISLLSKTFSDKYILRGLYIQDQPLLKACNSIFQKNFDKYFPELTEHFQEINFPLSSWISFWIQMCYVNVFPYYILLRVWDYFLVFGVSFLLSLGLSIVEYLYEDLINNDNPQNILEFFKKLNPNIKSSYKRFETIDYNIEDLISNAIKNYPITNDEINSELQILFPNYNNKYKYNIYQNKDNNQKNRNKETLTEKEKLDKKLVTQIEQTETTDNLYINTTTQNNTTTQKTLDIINSSKFSYNILEENQIETIELSISQNKKYSDNYDSENSCEEIEDENIYINEHIKDLMSKHSCQNKNSNLNIIK